MFASWRLKRIALAAVIATVWLLPTGASAITVDVAKKCNVLVGKAFPPRQVGNPAAGSSKGNAQAQRDYFKKCVENGGKMDDTSDKKPEGTK